VPYIFKDYICDNSTPYWYPDAECHNWPRGEATSLTVRITYISRVVAYTTEIQYHMSNINCLRLKYDDG
jgi:hypothetical protein